MVWDEALKAEVGGPLANLEMHVAQTPAPVSGATPDQPLTQIPLRSVCSPLAQIHVEVVPEGSAFQMPSDVASGPSPASPSCGLQMCMR